jgi:hypothetical protein
VGRDKVAVGQLHFGQKAFIASQEDPGRKLSPA